MKESLVPDTNDQIVVYCAAGPRSILAADQLQKMGYKNVLALQGGLSQWKDQGFDTIINDKSFTEMWNLLDSN